MYLQEVKTAANKMITQYENNYNNNNDNDNDNDNNNNNNNNNNNFSIPYI